jgi:hypothetical protein
MVMGMRSEKIPKIFNTDHLSILLKTKFIRFRWLTRHDMECKG